MRANRFLFPVVLSLLAIFEPVPAPAFGQVPGQPPAFVAISNFYYGSTAPSVPDPAVLTDQEELNLLRLIGDMRFPRYIYSSCDERAHAAYMLLARERYCRATAASGASCAGGAADEVVTDYDYGPNSGPNNLLPRGVTVTADGGAGLATQRTCYGYDDEGNRISETQPNANLTSCP